MREKSGRYRTNALETRNVRRHGDSYVSSTVAKKPSVALDGVRGVDARFYVPFQIMSELGHSRTCRAGEVGERTSVLCSREHTHNTPIHRSLEGLTQYDFRTATTLHTPGA